MKLLGAVAGVAAAVAVASPAQALSYGDVRASWLGGTTGRPAPADQGGVFRFSRDNADSLDTFTGTLVDNKNILVNNTVVNTFIGVCLEIGENVQTTKLTYTIRDVADAPVTASQDGTPMGAQRAASVAKLVQLAFGGYLSNALTAGANTVLAFQMALWELSIDRSGLSYDLTTGWQYTGAGASNTTAFGDAQSWLSQLWNDRNSNALPQAANLFAMTRGNPQSTAQDMLVQTPIPAAAWLLGSGLLGLFGIARRRRTVAA
jgi:hypothetical protein